MEEWKRLPHFLQRVPSHPQKDLLIRPHTPALFKFTAFGQNLSSFFFEIQFPGCISVLLAWNYNLLFLYFFILFSEFERK